MAKSARRIARRSGHQSDQTEAGGVPPGLTAAKSSPIDTKKLKIFMPGPIDKDFVPYMWRPMMRLLSYQYPVVRASIFPYMPDRHTNAWIENGRSPLQVGICYRLELNIGQLRELTPAAAVARSQDQESLSLPRGAGRLRIQRRAPPASPRATAPWQHSADLLCYNAASSRHADPVHQLLSRARARAPAGV